MTATRRLDSSTTTPRLHLAFELGWATWKLAFTTGFGQAPRLRSVPARDRAAVLREVAQAKDRFRLPADTPVVSCYEAGRDGFWLHRWLAGGVANRVVDSSSIEVNRRRRRAKSDGLDASKLLTMLLRYLGGETEAWSVVTPPTADDEDRRQLHRELLERKDERTAHGNRIKGLLANHGLAMPVVGPDFPERLADLRRWDGSAVGPDLTARLLREHQRWQFVDRQIKDLENERRKRLRRDDTAHVEPMRRLLQLGGVGLNGAWLLVQELFGWRRISNRTQLGALVGLTPTPYQSGSSAREQGISKAGNQRLRKPLVELAWGGLRWQPASALSRWDDRRVAGGGPRARKVGLVALARKLSVALWRYLEHGEVPAGATLGPWRPKVSGRDHVAA
jgi:transposase